MKAIKFITENFCPMGAFDFCSLFDMEQAKDIEHYQKQRNNNK